ncbi:MAG: response regulator [Limnoraphis robusta]|uniref:Chemotaxis protein CheY n=1 Tax=Limnoraphis robusta CS-951 TaxID=1637645 RepID=A0A0F5YFM3_9CYAN|nr:response regulator [Limnoraphis robusta]KKD37699.1 chemotaxis protein CheY [Limnoraphis robusta CS-951]MEA5495841.1 response regulator [Limnoraphis robusta BA-68 BA1]
MIDLNNYSILLVEDDANDILFVQRAFRQANLTNAIHIVKDGDQAIDYLIGNNQYANRDLYPIPVLILLDLKLPRLSGLEVLQWIKKHSSLRRIPVVVLTSSRENIDVNRAYDIGANSYLVKPVKFDTLTQMIEIIDAYWIKLNQYPTGLSI